MSSMFRDLPAAPPPKIVEEQMIIEAAFGTALVNGNAYVFFDVPLGIGAVKRVSIKFDRIGLAKVESEIMKLRHSMREA